MAFDGFRRSSAAVLLAAGFATAPAAADVSGFLGNWLGPDHSGLLGGLIGGSQTGDIARVVVTPDGVNHIRIHLYGHCQPKECDWGEELGHNHSDSPGSDEVLSVTAVFKDTDAVRQLTLRKGPGSGLRYELVTDFTDHSDRHDYETSGTFQPAPSASAPVASTAGMPAPAAPGGVIPGTAGPARGGGLAEDCEAINPDDVYVAPSGRGWKVNDFNHTILNFGANKLAAVRAAHVMAFYRFDEQCYVAQPHPKMIYWRTGGQVPRDPMPGQDCTDVHYATVAAKRIGDGWKVADGDSVLIDYGNEEGAAKLAASVIRAYHINRQCFVAKPDTTMVYWLAQ